MDAGGVNESLSAIADASHPSRIAPVERDTAHFSPRPLQGCDEAPLALKSYHISCPAALKRERHLFHFSVEKSEAPARLSRAQIIPQRHREGKRKHMSPTLAVEISSRPNGREWPRSHTVALLAFLNSHIDLFRSGRRAGLATPWTSREEIRRNLKCRPDRYENATAVDEERAPQVEVSGRRLHLRRALPHTARTRRRLA